MTRALSDTTTLDIMLRQETDYNINTVPSAVNVNINEAAINQMVAALEKIEDLCRLRHRETLLIATSYLVRYIHNTNISLNEEDLSRVALVCFYMACKINEPAALPLRTLTDLFQRFLHKGEATHSAPPSWEQLELNVCLALRWRLNPPMPMGFCDQFLATTLKDTKKLRKRAQACLDTAFRTNPCAFVLYHKSSSLAMAALLLAQRDKSTCLFDCVGQVSSGKDFPRALNFLQGFAASTQSSSSKKQRKRCVSPSLEPEESTRPRKRSKHTTLSPCLISTRSPCPPPVAKPCLLWTGSPRSALTMAE